MWNSMNTSIFGYAQPTAERFTDGVRIGYGDTMCGHWWLDIEAATTLRDALTKALNHEISHEQDT